MKKMMVMAGIMACGVVLNLRAADPGLPFMENFTNTNLRAPGMTTANWSVEEQKLLQAFYAGRAQYVNREWTGAGISADAHDSYAVAIGDMNGNGLPDLVVGNSALSVNRLYTNNGTANPFFEVTPLNISDDAHNTMSIAVGDVNGNGRLDVIVGNFEQANRLYTNNGTATPFAGVTGMDISSDAHGSFCIALGDMNGNGRLDVVVGN